MWDRTDCRGDERNAATWKFDKILEEVDRNLVPSKSSPFAVAASQVEFKHPGFLHFLF